MLKYTYAHFYCAQNPQNQTYLVPYRLDEGGGLPTPTESFTHALTFLLACFFFNPHPKWPASPLLLPCPQPQLYPQQHLHYPLLLSSISSIDPSSLQVQPPSTSTENASPSLSPPVPPNPPWFPTATTELFSQLTNLPTGFSESATR